MDQASGTEIASFPIYKVLFCARGREGSVESDCFSFTESYRSSEDFQIHVFSCHIKEAVSYFCILSSLQTILLWMKHLIWQLFLFFLLRNVTCHDMQAILLQLFVTLIVMIIVDLHNQCVFFPSLLYIFPNGRIVKLATLEIFHL